MNLDIEHVIERIVAIAPIAELEQKIASNQAGLDTVGLHGRTPLMAAACVGYLAAVEMLVKSGASARARGGMQLTPLHEAAANGETNVAVFLLSRGADVDAKTVDGVTPLMCAAAWGNTEVARVLLANGASRSIVDRFGANAADIAREKGADLTAELIERFLKKTNG